MAVVTVYSAPEDGGKGRPKHVEHTCSFNKHNTARVASCWFIIYYRKKKSFPLQVIQPGFLGCRARSLVTATIIKFLFFPGIFQRELGEGAVCDSFYFVNYFFNFTFFYFSPKVLLGISSRIFEKYVLSPVLSRPDTCTINVKYFLRSSQKECAVSSGKNK